MLGSRDRYKITFSRFSLCQGEVERHETLSVSSLIQSPLIMHAMKVSVTAESQGDQILLKADNPLTFTGTESSPFSSVLCVRAT